MHQSGPTCISKFSRQRDCRPAQGPSRSIRHCDVLAWGPRVASRAAATLFSRARPRPCGCQVQGKVEPSETASSLGHGPSGQLVPYLVIMNSSGQAHLGTPAPASVLGPVFRTSMTSMARTDAYAGVVELPIAASWRPSGVPPRWRPVWEIAIVFGAGMDDACGQLATSKSNTKRGVCIGTRHDKCLSQQSPARTPSGEG